MRGRPLCPKRRPDQVRARRARRPVPLPSHGSGGAVRDRTGGCSGSRSTPPLEGADTCRCSFQKRQLQPRLPRPPLPFRPRAPHRRAQHQGPRGPRHPHHRPRHARPLRLLRPAPGPTGSSAAAPATGYGAVRASFSPIPAPPKHWDQNWHPHWHLSHPHHQHQHH